MGLTVIASLYRKTVVGHVKVSLLEDGENCFHLRNLSQHLATYVFYDISVNCSDCCIPTFRLFVISCGRLVHSDEDLRSQE
jgi:hypothetical protein